MRPLAREKPPEMPFALDATDLDMIAKAAGSDARIRLVTPRYEYESADDLVKNATWSTKLVKLTVEFDDSDQLELVPTIRATGKLSRKLLPEATNVLENKRRAIWPWRLSVIVVGSAVVAGFSLLGPIAYERGRARAAAVQFDWSAVHWSFSWIMALCLLIVIRSAVTLPPLFFSHRISPTRREDSFVRKHVRSLPGVAIGAAITGTVALIIKMLNEH